MPIALLFISFIVSEFLFAILKIRMRDESTKEWPLFLGPARYLVTLLVYASILFVFSHGNHHKILTINEKIGNFINPAWYLMIGVIVAYLVVKMFLNRNKLG